MDSRGWAGPSRAWPCQNQVRPGQARQNPSRSRKGHPGLEPGPIRTRETDQNQVRMRHDPVKSSRTGPGYDQGKASQAQRKPVRASRVSLSRVPPGASPAKGRFEPVIPGRASTRHEQSLRTVQGKIGQPKTSRVMTRVVSSSWTNHGEGQGRARPRRANRTRPVRARGGQKQVQSGRGQARASLGQPEPSQSLPDQPNPVSGKGQARPCPIMTKVRLDTVRLWPFQSGPTPGRASQSWDPIRSRSCPTRVRDRPCPVRSGSCRARTSSLCHVPSCAKMDQPGPVRVNVRQASQDLWPTESSESARALVPPGNDHSRGLREPEIGSYRIEVA